MILSPTTQDFTAYMAENEPRARVHPAGTWADDLMRLAEQPVRVTGAMLPWSSTHDNVRFREGEVTLWAGINGSGKSQVTGNVALGFCAQEERTCIASFEMVPLRTLGRMQRQAAMLADHWGDTRGNDYYTEATCLAADVTAIMNFKDRYGVPSPPKEIIRKNL